MKSTSRVIQILNARKGEATYTTMRRAADLVQRNIAIKEEFVSSTMP